MTITEAKEVFLNRGFVKVNNGEIYDPDKWRQACSVISEWLKKEPKIGRCKECKYFEYDSIAKVNGIPLIVAHEICKKWSDGCKTKEDGYCFLFEPQESEGKE